MFSRSLVDDVDVVVGAVVVVDVLDAAVARGRRGRSHTVRTDFQQLRTQEEEATRVPVAGRRCKPGRVTLVRGRVRAVLDEFGPLHPVADSLPLASGLPRFLGVPRLPLPVLVVDVVGLVDAVQ